MDKNISPEERRCYDTIFNARKRLDKLKQKESEIYNDRRVAEDLLTLLLRDKYETLGFVRNASVMYNGKKHKLDSMFFNKEFLMMQVSLTPMPNPKVLFGNIFVDDLKLTK